MSSNSLMFAVSRINKTDNSDFQIIIYTRINLQSQWNIMDTLDIDDIKTNIGLKYSMHIDDAIEIELNNISFAEESSDLTVNHLAVCFNITTEPNDSIIYIYPEYTYPENPENVKSQTSTLYTTDYFSEDTYISTQFTNSIKFIEINDLLLVYVSSTYFVNLFMLDFDTGIRNLIQITNTSHSINPMEAFEVSQNGKLLVTISDGKIFVFSTIDYLAWTCYESNTISNKTNFGKTISMREIEYTNYLVLVGSDEGIDTVFILRNSLGNITYVGKRQENDTYTTLNIPNIISIKLEIHVDKLYLYISTYSEEDSTQNNIYLLENVINSRWSLDKAWILNKKISYDNSNQFGYRLVYNQYSNTELVVGSYEGTYIHLYSDIWKKYLIKGNVVEFDCIKTSNPDNMLNLNDGIVIDNNNINIKKQLHLLPSLNFKNHNFICGGYKEDKEINYTEIEDAILKEHYYRIFHLTISDDNTEMIITYARDNNNVTLIYFLKLINYKYEVDHILAGADPEDAEEDAEEDADPHPNSMGWRVCILNNNNYIISAPLALNGIATDEPPGKIFFKHFDRFNISSGFLDTIEGDSTKNEYLLGRELAVSGDESLVVASGIKIIPKEGIDHYFGYIKIYKIDVIDKSLVLLDTITEHYPHGEKNDVIFGEHIDISYSGDHFVVLGTALRNTTHILSFYKIDDNIYPQYRIVENDNIGTYIPQNYYDPNKSPLNTHTKLLSISDDGLTVLVNIPIPDQFEHIITIIKYEKDLFLHFLEIDRYIYTHSFTNHKGYCQALLHPDGKSYIVSITEFTEGHRGVPTINDNKDLYSVNTTLYNYNNSTNTWIEGIFVNSSREEYVGSTEQYNGNVMQYKLTKNNLYFFDYISIYNSTYKKAEMYSVSKTQIEEKSENSENIASGSLRVSGGIGVSGDVHIGGNVHIGGFINNEVIRFINDDLKVKSFSLTDDMGSISASGIITGTSLYLTGGSGAITGTNNIIMKDSNSIINLNGGKIQGGTIPLKWGDADSNSYGFLHSNDNGNNISIRLRKHYNGSWASDQYISLSDTECKISTDLYAPSITTPSITTSGGIEIKSKNYSNTFGNISNDIKDGALIFNSKHLYGKANEKDVGWAIQVYDDDLRFYHRRDPANNPPNGPNGYWTQKAFLNDNSNSTSSGTIHINFTGQHRCVTNTFSYTEDKVGYIVSTGTNYKHINSTSQNKINNIKISESLPFVDITTKTKDKKVFGVISDGEDVNESSRTYQVGAFGSRYSKNKDDNRIYINSVGEGAIWVCDFNGPLENGDYITSSDIPGIGQRQDIEFLANYTVAKITMDCAFVPNMEPHMIWNKETEKYEHKLNEYLPEYQMKYIKLDGTIITEEEYHAMKNQGESVYKMAFVGCTYHCG